MLLDLERQKDPSEWEENWFHFLYASQYDRVATL